MLCGELLADLERFRPAVPSATSERDAETALRERAALRLGELYREFRVDEAESDLAEDSQFALYKREGLDPASVEKALEATREIRVDP